MSFKWYRKILSGVVDVFYQIVWNDYCCTLDTAVSSNNRDVNQQRRETKSNFAAFFEKFHYRLEK